MGNSIHAFLGDANRKFLETGFKDVSHRIFDVNIDTEETRAEATAAVVYPPRRQNRERREMRPHLSTIDGLVIGAQMSEVYIKEAYGLGEDDTSRIWLRRCVLKAGLSPVLDLSNLAVTTTHSRIEVDPGSKCGYISHLTSHLGTMTVDMALDHPIVAQQNRSASYPDIDASLGASEKRYFGVGYKNVDTRTTDVSVNREERSAAATIELVTPAGDRICRGMGGDYMPYVSPIDAMLSVVQLAQVILQEHHGSGRDRFQSMWIRKLVIDNTRPVFLPEAFTVTTWMKKTDVLSTNGAQWRTATFGVSFPAIDGGPALAGELTIAHQL